MIIETNEHGTIVLKDVFNPIKLQTKEGETLIITMRDSGFEVFYENNFYELKKGNISKNKGIEHIVKKHNETMPPEPPKDRILREDAKGLIPPKNYR